MIQKAFTIIAVSMATIGMVRLGFLLVFRRPVAAQVVGTDLSESERLYDGDMHFIARHDNMPTTEDIPFRSITTRVAFDVAGRSYRTDVSLLTYKGYRPDTTVFVWYAPSNPSVATGIGPEWACALLVPLVALIAYLYL